MDTTTYEFFITRCLNCERFEHGANTDTWQELLVNYWHFKNPTPLNSSIVKIKCLKQLKKTKNSSIEGI